MDCLRWFELEQNPAFHFEICIPGDGPYTIWREINQRRHGEVSSPSIVLIKKIDKTMRNKFTIIRKKGDKDFEGGMATWFDTRLS